MLHFAGTTELLEGLLLALCSKGVAGITLDSDEHKEQFSAVYLRIRQDKRDKVHGCQLGSPIHTGRSIDVAVAITTVRRKGYMGRPDRSDICLFTMDAEKASNILAEQFGRREYDYLLELAKIWITARTHTPTRA